MKVTLLAHSPMPEKMVAGAARVCYSGAKDLDTLLESLTDDKIDAFLKKMQKMPAHGSVWEHNVFTFGIEGVSRALSHQLVRHRIASYDQQSQRYVNSSQFEYVVPHTVERNEEANALFENTMKDLQVAYDKLVELGMPKEDARFVLPNACATRLICSMNVRSLMHFFALRLCTRAQWEIRELAQKMWKLCQEVSPEIFVKGANCEQLGYCPEGDMCCGRKPTLETILKVYNEKKDK